MSLGRRTARHPSTGATTAHDKWIPGPLLIAKPVECRNPSRVQLRRLCAHLPPCDTPRLLESQHAGPKVGQVVSQQFKISRFDAATGAVTQDQNRACPVSKIKEKPARSLRRIYRDESRGHDQIKVS